MTTAVQVIGFLGSGQMASALGHGFVTAGVAKPEQLIGFDVSPEALQRFNAATGGRIATTQADSNQNHGTRRSSTPPPSRPSASEPAKMPAACTLSVVGRCRISRLKVGSHVLIACSIST